MKITGIIGSSYLCSTFINHDKTIVTDHPIYVFSTNAENAQVAIMFASKTNPFTTYYPDGKPLGFIGCSTYRGEVPNLRVFQAELYIFNAHEAKLSDYQFKYEVYNANLLKALRNALKYKAITSVHNFDDAEDRDDKDEILVELERFINYYLEVPRGYPIQGIVNCDYQDFKKDMNKMYTEQENKKIWEEKFK